MHRDPAGISAQATMVLLNLHSEYRFRTSSQKVAAWSQQTHSPSFQTGTSFRPKPMPDREAVSPGGDPATPREHTLLRFPVFPTGACGPPSSRPGRDDHPQLPGQLHTGPHDTEARALKHHLESCRSGVAWGQRSPAPARGLWGHRQPFASS